MNVKEILEVAVKLKPVAANLTTEEKNTALECMAQSLLIHKEEILKANEKDLSEYKGGVMADRLYLDEKRIEAMAQGILDVIMLPDPVGRVLEERTLYNGLILKKVSVPIGVVAVIYESRPNVTSDAAALLIKSGNVCVLRGGKEAFNSSMAIIKALKEGLKKAGLSENLVNMPDSADRSQAQELMTATGKVNLLIPRGGAGLIRACVENATVPCIETGTGICHIYVDEYADIEKALSIVENAKMSRPSVCNAAEVCLVHSNVAKEFLPLLKEKIGSKCKLILCDNAAKIIDGEKAREKAFDTEYLDYILAVRIVDSVAEAAEHIALHSTQHSEAIITENEDNAKYFTSRVDSAAVYVNASTRFTDGGEFGLGCEIGISTQRLHARGPMGLKEMNTYKYVIIGNGEVR
ncbi:MAG: glutamate-5-semialdehyde dehydrogenase [Acutalibacteraceae bacterium]|nr:glutamate-5-semialdehyde dehydrogenase [Acutalibacteraceae bacterium]